LVTVTLGKEKTSIYLDGVLAKASEIQGKPVPFDGLLVVGTSPTVSDSWSGRIMRLAIYNRQLTSEQVFAHYAEWTRNRQPTLGQDDGTRALYLFNEGSGSVIHNLRDAATDLTIPEHYFVLHSGFLSLPWRHYHATRSYWTDVAVNVVGF